MAKKLEKPLVIGGNEAYPLTTADQIIMSDGSRLETESGISVAHAENADNAEKLGGYAVTALTNSFIDKIYPIGSTYVTSTNESPASYLGGTWELFDKEFTYLGTNSLANFVTLNTTNCTSVSGSIVRTGHQLFFKVGIKPAVAITDTITEMFTFNLADIGVSSLTVDIYSSFFSDGGQACVSANITTAGVFRTTDVFVRNTTNNSLAAETSVGQALINYNIYWKHMLDSACDKFYWKRTA